MNLRAEFDALDENRMASYVTSVILLVVCTVASIGSLYMWLDYDPTRLLEAEIPGYDSLPPGAASSATKADLTGVFEAMEGQPSDLPGNWPSFRGPSFDNISADAPTLATSWPANGPEILWSVDIGNGYAAPSVLNGIVYLMDYDEEDRKDLLRAFSLEDGSEIWRRSYKVMVKRNHGMSRTIPAVTESTIVTIGPKCHVVCLDTATGDFKWGIDLQSDYGTVEPLWYAAQCPLIEDGKVLLAPCGTDVLMMAVDCDTGEVQWTTPNPRKWDMSHASIIPMTILGKKMYVYAALGGILAVSAEEDDIGSILWEIHWVAKVVAPSPVPVGDDHILITAGYGTGNMMLKIVESGGTYSAEVEYAHAPGDGLSCEQQTPIYSDGLLYGIMPKDAGSLKGQFVAYNPDGSLNWSSGSDNRFGFGPFLKADNKFYILDDHGVLTMLEASTSGYKQLGQAEVLHGHDPWGPIALAGSRMLLRDMDNLICVEIGA
ncbi:MAG: PQQ-binding-like beta-propeller repeat protein [Candidatus Hydrogenedentota bacterium]